jgi:lipopolysaccharide transport system ATP-binding protein
MSRPIIDVEGLGKKYRLGGPSEGRARYQSLRDTLMNTLRAAGRRLRRPFARAARQERSEFWALRDVAFAVEPGEVVGIIGRNGAGKSTLLKVLSRITEPTTGQVTLRGRVASLLEVGTGFHQELSGRENVFLNGTILGMSQLEIRKKFDEIVAFAEVEQFLDTPVKRYSSGMYMRLAFAVAAHLEPEILVVDEVLAVGDAAFQKKCLGKMGDVARGGRTVLFVSHNMHAVNSLCARGLVLQRGQVVFDGTAAAAVARYLDLAKPAGETEVPAAARPGSGEWRFAAVAARKAVFAPDEPKEFTFRAEPAGAAASTAYLSGLLVNDQGTVLTQFDSRLLGVWLAGTSPVCGNLRVDGIWLRPGRYSLDLYLCSQAGIIDIHERAAEFEVSPLLPYPQSVSPDATAGALVLTDFTWRLDT